MKKLQILLLALIFSFGFSSLSYSQTAIHRVVTRYACAGGTSGCYGGPVTLKLYATSSVFNTHLFSTLPDTHSYLNYTNISVTVAGLTSAGGPWTLPVNIGDVTFIDPASSGLDDGVHHAYGVYITKTGVSGNDHMYTLSVSDNAY